MDGWPWQRAASEEVTIEVPSEATEEVTSEIAEVASATTEVASETEEASQRDRSGRPGVADTKL